MTGPPSPLSPTAPVPATPVITGRETRECVSMVGREAVSGHAAGPFGSMACKTADGVLRRRRADRRPSARDTAWRGPGATAGTEGGISGAGFLACLPGRLAAVRGVEGFEFVQERLQLITVDNGLAARPG